MPVEKSVEDEAPVELSDEDEEPVEESVEDEDPASEVDGESVEPDVEVMPKMYQWEAINHNNVITTFLRLSI